MSEHFFDAKYYDDNLYGIGDIKNSVKKLIKQVNYLSNHEKQQLVNCCFFAACAHEGQIRQSREPYICHPIKVAEILAKDVRFDLVILEAAILHDVIEDTPVSKVEVITAFSQEVADLVDGVSKLEKDKSLSAKELQAKTFEKLAHAMQADPRVVMIKLADRMHNMQTLDSLRPEKRRRIARETLEVYVPIASRLGMFVFKEELEELVFKQIHPWRYDVVYRLLKNNQLRKDTIAEVTKKLQMAFNQHGIVATVRQRQRNLYNVYQKIKKSHFKRRPLEKASVPFVILTESIEDCYSILGIIHNLYTPVFKKFTDYIASPKVNGYQSIHTSVLTKDRRVINFQIRTKAMHAVAESGIIAIWRYHNQSKKNLTNKDLPKDRSMRRWLDNIKLLSTLTTNPIEFYEAVKRDFIGFEIQVLTPKGEPIGLPEGATVIDFAYHIHTDIGNYLESAKVNDIKVAVDFELSDGQTVELFTNALSTPQSHWLKLVKTARARTALRHYFRSFSDDELAQMGYKEMKSYLVKKKNNCSNLLDNLEKIATINYQIKLKSLLKKIALSDIKRENIFTELQKLTYPKGKVSIVSINVYNQPGVLAFVTDIIAKYEANILRISFPEEVRSKEMLMIFEIYIELDSQLKGIIASLKTLDLIKHIEHEETK